MTKITLRIAFFVLLLSFSMAGLGLGNYVSYGIGNKSCGFWLEARRTDNYYEPAHWILGFVSGVGYASSSFSLNETEGQAMVVWMDNFCQANPLSQIDQGAESLVDELRK